MFDSTLFFYPGKRFTTVASEPCKSGRCVQSPARLCKKARNRTENEQSDEVKALFQRLWIFPTTFWSTRAKGVKRRLSGLSTPALHRKKKTYSHAVAHGWCCWCWHIWVMIQELLHRHWLLFYPSTENTSQHQPAYQCTAKDKEREKQGWGWGGAEVGVWPACFHSKNATRHQSSI